MATHKKRVPVGTNIRGNITYRKPILKGHCLNGGEGAVDLCLDCWSFSLSKYVSVLKMFRNKLASLEATPVPNYELATLSSV